MQLRRIPDSSTWPSWIGWGLIVAVTIVGHTVLVITALWLWRLLILAC